ncbi:MAG: hypothetical protein H6721_17120 [Sandaracinus sp.]|nr:hypothetical protein [Sandaracinus sp.]
MRELRLGSAARGRGCVGYDAGIELAVELRIAPPTRAVPMGDGFATLSEVLAPARGRRGAHAV